MRVLIVGGYGAFGGRLVRLLADEARLTVLVAGRSRTTAEAFCAALGAQARLVPAAFDRDGNLDAQLAALVPDLLVDASGPFQAYGADPYRVAKACIARRVVYLDLADDRAFVKGIHTLDASARNAGVAVLSGASTVPALTGAATRRLTHGMPVHAVMSGIAPSPRVVVGRSVVAAIASYAGKPLAPRGAPALIDSRRYTIAPPGYPPLERIRFSLVDVPDFAPGLDSWTGAGPRPAILHRALSTLAWLVRLKLLPSLAPFACVFHAVLAHMRVGEDRGGMFVEVSGDGIARSWHLIAEGDDGPFIPVIAASALIGRTLTGSAPAAGARPATGEVELEDYERVFAKFRIATGTRERRATDASLPLYPRFFGEAYARLPEAIRDMHDGTADGGWTAEGRADIERGRGLLARLVGRLNRFPGEGRDVPVTVRFDASGGRERWTRNFGGREFSSVQSEGSGRNEGLIAERFGPLVFGLEMTVDDDRLRLKTRQWSAFGIPLPRFLAPVGDSYEHVDAAGTFHFHVEIGFPWTGLIVRYRGWLKRKAPAHA
jgi:hypothetical protein